MIAAAAHNPGRILRALFGIGKPKTLQGHSSLAALVQLLITRLQLLIARRVACIAGLRDPLPPRPSRRPTASAA